MNYDDAVHDWELDLLGLTRKEHQDQLLQEELKRQRIERFTQFFGRVNSAFTFRKVTVKVENSELNAPAWSGASEVTFNSRLIGDLNDAKSIAGIKGLDLHEISHILYTSREGSELFTYVRENNFMTAYNALEDQRIETLFTSKYPSTIAWFTATILIHFVENAEAFTNSYPLLRGRRYLPVELRARSRNSYSEPENIDAICEIIDEYRTLIFPTDTEKGKDLIRRFNDLLPKVNDSGGGTGSGDGTGDSAGTEKVKVVVKVNDPFGHGSRPSEGIETSVDSRPVSPKKQQKDSQRAQQLNQEDDSELAQQLNDAPVIEIDLTDLDSGDSAGSGSSTGDSLENHLQDLLDEILDDSQIQSEINEIIQQIGGLPSLASNKSKTPDTSDYQNQNVDANTFQASLSFSRELERLRANFDPAWEKFESQGRLIVDRYVRGENFDTIFDQWNEGLEDATEIECVIALDNSGSMTGYKSLNAYKAMYAIKRALDRINANTTVLTFNSSTQVLYKATDRAGSTIRNAGSTGGTEPEEAIKYATRVLAESEKPVRIFFVITDGEWAGDQKQNHDAIDRMARAGVLTAFAYIPEQNENNVVIDREKSHHAEIGAVIKNPLDLISMARSIVKYAINRRLVNH